MNQKSKYNVARDRAERIQNGIRARAVRICNEAGLDGTNLLGIHPHNAMIDYERGRPWPGVDYKKVKLVLYLTNEYMWRASRLIDNWTNRLRHEITPEEYSRYLFS
jgi:hypothetical protein